MSFANLLGGGMLWRRHTNILDRVLRLINAYVGKPLNSNTLRVMQEDLDQLFVKSFKNGERWTLFNGVEITGCHVFSINGLVTFKWQTAFLPCARYGGQYGKVDPLGFLENLDLYVWRQGPDQFIYIARCGERQDEYISKNVGWGLPEPSETFKDVFDEAARRAKALGMLDDSIPEEPILYSEEERMGFTVI